MLSKQMRDFKVFTILVILLVLFILLSLYQEAIMPMDSKGVDKDILIPKGATTSQIAKILYDNNLIKNRTLFILMIKFKGFETKLKAGEYLLNTNMSLYTIIDNLLKGSGEEGVRVVIPEGYTIRQIAEKLSELGLVNKDRFIYLADKGDFNFEFLKSIPKNRPHRLEGYLFPDTYIIKKGATEEEIITMMLKRFNEVFKKEYYDRAKEIGETQDKIIIIASLIEKEAVIPDDRPMIAGVIYNRLKKGMKLQIDASVLYALGGHKDVVLYKDLEVDSPYNTYKYEGLPIGPICNPGLKSIEAALYPAKHDYYYYVAKEDGSHIFSKTYKEHIAVQNNMKK